MSHRRERGHSESYWQMKDDISRVLRLCRALFDMTLIPGWEATAQRDRSLERDLRWCVRRYQIWGVQYQAANAWGLWSYMQRRSMRKYSIKMDDTLSILGLTQYTSQYWDVARPITIQGFGGRNLWGDGAPNYVEEFERPRNGLRSRPPSEASRRASRSPSLEIVVEEELPAPTGNDPPAEVRSEASSSRRAGPREGARAPTPGESSPSLSSDGGDEAGTRPFLRRKRRRLDWTASPLPSSPASSP